MSLVNDMLNDLEKRRASAAPQALDLSNLTASAAAKKSLPLGLIVALLLLVALIVFLWFWLKPGTPETGIAQKTIDANIVQSNPQTSFVEQRAEKATEANEVTIQKNTTLAVSEKGAEESMQTENVQASEKSAATVQLAERSEKYEQPAVRTTEKTNDKTKEITQSVNLPKKVAANKTVTSAELTQADANLLSESLPDTAAIKKVRPLSVKQKDTKVVAEARNAIQRGNSQQAELMLATFLDEYPQALQSRQLLASLYIQQRRLVDAELQIKHLSNKAISHVDLSKLQSRVLLAQEKPNDALVLLVQHAPPVAVDVEYHELIGAAAQRSGDYDLAADTYRNLIRQDATQADWWVAFGIALDGQGNTQTAAQVYRKALGMNRLNPSLKGYAIERVKQLGGV